jgi:hypothetical protein
MKRYLQRLRRTGLQARRLFNSLALFLFTISCTKEFIKTDGSDAQVPFRIEHAYTIELTAPQFAPHKITSDVSGRIFVVGNNRRLIFIEGNKRIEEIILESIYPCEIVDINTDGFDIFLLDRLNSKIWTIKQKTLLEKGFSLEDRPLHLAISERNYMALTFSDRKELSIFSKNEKLFTGIHLDTPFREDDVGDLLFRENVLYIANRKNGQIDVLPLFNPSQRRKVTVPAPTSLAMDRQSHLFIAYAEGIGYLRGSELELLHPMKDQEVEITIHDDFLFVLTPSKEKIDVYSIVYSTSDSNVR